MHTTDPLLTLLLPCKNQTEEFLRAAIDSVLNQTSPHWKLLVVVEDDSPAHVTRVIEQHSDPRITRLVSTGGSFASALNAGITHADTQFVAILLSDDRLDPRAVEVVERNVARYPEVDFFHSARRYIDDAGEVRSPVMPSAASFTLDHFTTIGSPVKHLLCWRRAKGIELGNMDEALTKHGCDDFDFPWRMAEAGCTFRAIPECLYYYRVHQAGDRLTTHTPLAEQVTILRATFQKHRVPEPCTSRYIQRALDTYLIDDFHMDYRNGDPLRPAARCFRVADVARLQQFREQGYAQRYLFPHRAYVLRKGGPDGFKMAVRMCGVDDPTALREVVLYGLPPTIDEFPPDLFLDSDIQWHQQHFGRIGQVATANLVVDADRMYGMNFLSDLVQRISRRREFKTRVENRFKGWNRLLVNAILNFALDCGVKHFLSPRSDFVIRQTDPQREVQSALFTRVYDTALCKHWDVESQGNWWRIDVARNAQRIVPLDKHAEFVDGTTTICVLHDIERGRGHTTTDRRFAEAIETPSRTALDTMLAIESRRGVRATYNVLGTLFDEVRSQIERDGHALGFHSYDHQVEAPTRSFFASWIARSLTAASRQSRPVDQLGECRNIDYRIKGYRPPQSRITRALSDRRLSEHNFEWFASSAYSLGFDRPRLENGIVKIPIMFDDFDMYCGRTKFAKWSEEAIAAIQQNDLVVFGLHDCYAQHWLHGYEEFLARITELGDIKTLDELSAHTLLCSARWVY